MRKFSLILYLTLYLFALCSVVYAGGLYNPSSGGIENGGTAESPVIIDADGEVFVARKDGDAGDVVTINTMTSPVLKAVAVDNDFQVRDGGVVALGKAGRLVITASATPSTIQLLSAGHDLKFVTVSGSFIFDSGAGEVVLTPEAGATFQLGKDAATPILQEIKAHDASGTDIAGADLTVAAGNGTGTSAGGNLNFNTTLAGGASNATQNPSATQFIVKNTGAVHIIPRATPPGTPALGDFYVDSDLNLPCFYNGTSWLQMDDFTTVCS